MAEQPEYESSAWWARRRVLVTGCTGILGSWLALRLVELGADVVGLVRDHIPTSNLWRYPGGASVTQVGGDLLDFELVQRTLNEYEIDTVFHLAAQTIVPIANNSPLSTFETNMRGSWILLEAARLTPGVRAVIVASSDKAYGETEDLPYRETHRLEGRTPYDVSKSCVDLICQTYHHHYGLPVCISRCGNIFGGGDLNWSRLIPGTIRSGLCGEHVRIRSDGTPVRDYVYVKDVVSSYLAIAHGMERAEVIGQAFNVSGEAPRPVLEVAGTICELLGMPFEPVIQYGAASEIPAQYLDSQKIRELVGWAPAWELRDALSETIAWYRDFLADGRVPPAALRNL